MRHAPRLAARLASARGFTLLEMIIVIAVLAILVSISTPAIYKFMQIRDIQAEETAQGEVLHAMQAYLADKGTLPSDAPAASAANFWAKELAGYTNLSVREIQFDTWGHDRMYVALVDATNRNIMGTQVKVNYASLFSKGPNNKAEKTDASGNTITGIAINGNEYYASSNGGWWKNMANPTSAFAGLSGGGDDIMVRYTDYSEKLDAYNKTLDRLDRISQALETYARSGYAERSAACSIASPPADCSGTYTTPEVMVYYPRAAVSGDVAALYTVGNTALNTASANDTTRRSAMITLMRTLGLPDDFCCSALEYFTAADGSRLTKPFFYYSNPKPRTASGCGARPTTGTKLPARLSTVADTCG